MDNAKDFPMFTRHVEKIVFPMTFVLAATLLPLGAQQPNTTEGGVSTEAIATYTGGAVRGKRAVTQTTLTTISSTAWTTLATSDIYWTVAANTTDLFNFAFSAECYKGGGGWLYIRVYDATTGQYLSPYDGAQVFCSAPYYATQKGNWALRTSLYTLTRTHHLVVQFRVSAGYAYIDDWTAELVVYD